MKAKIILILFFLIVGIISVKAIFTSVSADILGSSSNPSPLPLQPFLIDGSQIPQPASDNFEITGLVNYIQSQNKSMNVLYYKVVVPDDTGNQWNLSQSFMERKPTIILKPVNDNGNIIIRAIFTSDFYWTYACCNIQKGDLLYTANASNPDGSFNITLAGTLTNNYAQNWKTRVYNSTSTSWGNVNIGSSTNVDIYNRRAKLHSDGTIVGYAMESINVTVPTLIKIYKV